MYALDAFVMHQSTLYCNEMCCFMLFPCYRPVESSLPVLKKGRNVTSRYSLRGSVPKNGPIDFASKNHFSLKSADREGLVPKY